MTENREQIVKEYVTEILRYWEPRRLLYNVILIVATLRDFHNDGALHFLYYPRILVALAMLAVAANIAFCAAHLVDFCLQLTPLKRYWMKMRWLLLLAGIWLAVLLAHWQTTALTGAVRMV